MSRGIDLRLELPSEERCLLYQMFHKGRVIFLKNKIFWHKVCRNRGSNIIITTLWTMYKKVNVHKPGQRLLTTPSQIFSSLIADVQRARRSIDMEFYIYEDDNIGNAFARLLMRKARQGIPVRLLLDGYGSRNISRKLCNSLINSGVEVCMTSRIGISRNHRRMVIIDGNIAYVGGVNIADRYVVGNTLGVWHDVELRMEGYEASMLLKIFEYDLMLYHGVVGDILNTSSGNVGIYCSEFQHSITRLFEDIVDNAHSELIITVPYLFPTAMMVEKFRKAVERGVRVVIIVPERCDVWLLDDVMRSAYKEVIGVGVDVRLLRGAFVHAKMALIDGQRVVLGSANLDARSFHINRELMLSTAELGVCRAADMFVTSLLDKSTPPSSHELRSRIPRLFVDFLKPYL